MLINGGNDMEKYLDASLSPRERAEDLLSKMTIQEKVGQLNQRLYGFRIYERNGDEFTLTDEFKQEVARFGGLGVLYGLYRADPWADKDETTGITKELTKKAFNMVQQYILEHSRLKIPMMMSTECPHGHQAIEGGLLPVNLCAGATFHPELLEEGYEASGEELSACHVDLALMSVLDVLRDPRWGRSEECYSEDPYLSARMASAAVRGMQKADVSVVAKHFCAQGETTGGVNASAARIGERELREIHLPTMKACCEEQVEGVMAAYNEIDGVYCHANSWLLNDVLRDELGFRGIVMADGVAVDCLNAMTNDSIKSGALALNSGVDVSLWDTGFSKLDEALASNYITEEVLDRAVLRVLELKFKRGLFEHPLIEGKGHCDTDDRIKAASKAIASESVVLLKNEDELLPIHNKKKIALIGPGANEIYYQLGDYTPPVQRDACSTILDGLKAYEAEGYTIGYAKGCDFFDGTSEQFEEAMALIEESDLVVCVIGGSSSRFHGANYDVNGAAIATEKRNEMDCGEGMDCASLKIPHVQEELLQTIAALHVPVVTIILAGRPYVISEIETLSNALLYAFYPGPMGGEAIAELLFGKTAPSGRLPVSLPREVGQLPVYYNYKSSYQAMKYYDLDMSPLHTFGEGLTYTNFSYSNFCMEPVVENASEGTSKDAICSVRFHVRNEGEVSAYVVPQLYIHHVTSSVVARKRELKNFTKVMLAPGEEREITLSLSIDDLSIWGASMLRQFNVGATNIIVSDQGTDLWSATIETFENKQINIVK